MIEAPNLIKEQWDTIAPTLKRYFGDVRELREDITPYLRYLQLEGGECLFREGDPAEGFYILLTGRLAVVIENADSLSEINEIAQGECVGELALLNDLPRSASVYAKRDSALIVVSTQEFEEFLSAFPTLGFRICRTLSNRIARIEGNLNHSSPPSTVVVLSLSSTVDPIQFSEHLNGILKPYRNSILIPHHSFLFPDFEKQDLSLNKAKVARSVEQLERVYDTVFFACDLDSLSWTSLCFRQADEIIFLADASQDPDPDLAEERLFQEAKIHPSIRKTLVLVHESSESLPSGTRRWLETRNVEQHYHVFKDNKADGMERVARHVLRELVGLVLAGGGARGYAHVGLWKSLTERTVPIDCIGGVSMGALLGGLIAMGRSWEEVLELCERFGKTRPSGDFNFLPVMSLIKGKRIDKILRMFDGLDIEDCPIPLLTIATDLAQSAEVIHRKGNLRRAIRASLSIPGLVPPVIHGNSVLIDGGIVNNFPVDVLRDLEMATIIGNDLDAHQEVFPEVDSPPSNWEVVWDKLFHREGKYNQLEMGNIILRSTLLCSSAKRQSCSDLTDILVKPNVAKYSITKWNYVQPIMKIGYDTANKTLDDEVKKIDRIPFCGQKNESSHPKMSQQLVDSFA